MIMFAIGGKAAESISNGKSETAVYKFISKTDQIDFKIAIGYAKKLKSNPPDQELLIAQLFAKERLYTSILPIRFKTAHIR